MSRNGFAWLSVALFVLLIWIGSALVRVENERYALSTGLCDWDMLTSKPPCRPAPETRTGWWWHLYYALTD